MKFSSKTSSSSKNFKRRFHQNTHLLLIVWRWIILVSSVTPSPAKTKKSNQHEHDDHRATSKGALAFRMRLIYKKITYFVDVRTLISLADYSNFAVSWSEAWSREIFGVLQPVWDSRKTLGQCDRLPSSIKSCERLRRFLYSRPRSSWQQNSYWPPKFHLWIYVRSNLYPV